MKLLVTMMLALVALRLWAGEKPWYIQGNFEPVKRLEFTLVNTLDIDRQAQQVEFIGTALVVKAEYKPEYQFVSSNHGNHIFRIGRPRGNTFEYLLSSAWSEGEVYNNPKDFTDYILRTRLEYESPVRARFIRIHYLT